MSPQLTAFVNNLYDANFFVMLLEINLPVAVVGFDQYEKLWETLSARLQRRARRIRYVPVFIGYNQEKEPGLRRALLGVLHYQRHRVTLELDTEAQERAVIQKPAGRWFVGTVQIPGPTEIEEHGALAERQSSRRFGTSGYCTRGCNVRYQRIRKRSLSVRVVVHAAVERERLVEVGQFFYAVSERR